MNTIDSIINNERLFSINGYTSNRVDFDIVNGKNKILISAPHCINHTRLGKLKYADMFTGGLSIEVGRQLDAYIIYNQNSNVDPNFDIESSYKNKIIDIIEKNKIKVVLDIHGSALSRDFDIDYKTSNLDKIQTEKLKELAHIHGLSKVSFNFFNSSDNTIVQSVGRIVKTPIIQLEINRRYRDPIEYADNIESTTKLIQSIALEYL